MIKINKVYFVGVLDKLLYTISKVGGKDMGKKMFKVFIIELFIVIIIFFYFYYNNYSNDIHYESVNNSQLITEQENDIGKAPKKTNTYVKLEKALLEGDTIISIKNGLILKDPKEIFSILEDISTENPEIMYYKGAKYTLGKITLFYSKSKEDMDNHKKEIRIIRENFVKEHILETMSDYEKVLKVHDYIINNSRYDNRLEKIGSLPPESNSSYGILALEVGVCEAYAKATKYLLDGVGVESIVVTGESRGENHAWNLVKVNGEYYHVDPTWDDPITNNDSDILRYNYFNLSDDDISKSHSWDREKYPAANSSKYNYFNYNDLIVYDINELQIKMKNILLRREDKYAVKIINDNLKDIKINEIVENIAYNNYELVKLKSYTYSFDEEHGIVNLEFSYH